MSRTIGEAGATLPENAVHPGPQWQQQACEDFFSQMACSARKAGLSFLSRQQRGHSSAGRAPAWHAGGQRFDPAWLHQIRTLGRSSFASPSSRGLGHHPFTVATGVRIPVGTPFIENKDPDFAGSFLLEKLPAQQAMRKKKKLPLRRRVRYYSALENLDTGP